ncbi:hypothetical protein ST12_10265 [Clostridium botulinum]|uniref:hypothetical protein n=2 Tax=Clostridium botulinum TaxID=1491 RepID=UPI000174E79F|nr:hypothetical protein [Clostridium botulinum]ACD54174.1 hypothetical protein CLH_2186 [Clostridium botulinum E3 str. Alaska E43]AJF30058.1 hypothetical protein ST13_10265 [Clostridium botulinum]AJF33121.1 hypothetical protein ST12_10265 [Clostridium botulinum]MBY6788751.1 hypothetical protein [Clostridium botulinum]MBY6816407.1 hypothetical protein [Clostridium botulinum]
MYIKSKGNIIISTILTFSIVMLLGSFSFIVMKNNNEMSYLYSNNGDIYSLLEDEEKSLLSFNKQLNKMKKEEIFIENFNIKDDISELQYEVEKDKFYLLTGDNICRELKYMFNESKVFLIPVYKNIDINS